jgi:dihydrofolate synthase/folylpolyglutamate synthase
VDHAAWLGSDREAIGREKAGIFRPQRPAVCSDPHPPASLLAHAAELGTALYRLGEAFDYCPDDEGWSWQGANVRYDALPLPALRGAFQLQNAAGVVMALVLLGERLALTAEQIRRGLSSVSLPGRFQLLPGAPSTIVDVAHNPQSAGALAANLKAQAVRGRTHAVVGVLADKDLAGVIRPMLDCVDLWYPATLAVPRGSDSSTLRQAITALGGTVEQDYATVSDALAAARGRAEPGDRIVVFGSFYTVAEALAEAV